MDWTGIGMIWVRAKTYINKNHMTKYFWPQDRINWQPDDWITKCKLDRMLGSKQYFWSYVFFTFWTFLFIYSVICYSIYSVLWIRCTGAARHFSEILIHFLTQELIPLLTLSNSKSISIMKIMNYLKWSCYFEKVGK